MLTSSIQQIRAAELLSNYRLTPATLMAKLDAQYIASKWVLYLSYKIAQCVSRGYCGLLISAPPRHGKSKLATIATPLWVLENFPHLYTGVVTYGADLSEDFAREIRDYIQLNPSLLNVRLRDDATRIANFLTTKGGGLRSVGLKGTITGRGFNVLVIDDYIKEPKEAESATYLEGLWTWYRTVARTRLEPGAVIIIVATRWVRNDLHGRLMKLQEVTGRNFWEYVELPALATDDPKKPDPLGREPGDPLFPERYTKQDILDIKMEVGSRWFESMFQQNPMGDEGAVIDPNDIRIVGATTTSERGNHPLWKDRAHVLGTIRNDPQRFIIGRYWDMASTKDAGDYTSGALGIWDKARNEFGIWHVARGQWSPAKVEAEFAKIANTDQIFPNLLMGMEEEPGSSGKYSVRHFQGILNQANISIALKPKRADSSKMLNAQPFLAHIEAEKVWMLEDTWNADFIEELSTFPEGIHDDQVDAVSGVYKLVRGLIGMSPVWGHRNPGLITQKSPELITSGSSLTWGSRK